MMTPSRMLRLGGGLFVIGGLLCWHYHAPGGDILIGFGLGCLLIDWLFPTP